MLLKTDGLAPARSVVVLSSVSPNGERKAAFMTGAVHNRQPGKAECPWCHMHNLRELKKDNQHYCRNCNKHIPLTEIVWRQPKRKVAGSGVVAGPCYMRGYANWTSGRRRQA